ncbi:hypothetical protein Trco_001373 [Trichoderma cornu-damae]|uniref:Uncharacterized protein n=1 Tax=Trichoderma cornu-damae TaxID=654480 RepID=A0A9P8QYZ6_9HYPO|nr:hypothetical protein Trco_001373 [Trichoderma cornu-damae]
MGVLDSVGTLLADIANLISDGQRILSISDKRHWGQDEREQERALEAVLDEARKDFQELGPLVNGRSQYEHDRRHESMEELRTIRAKFQALTAKLKDWSRSGGPIDPTWVRETHSLQRELHRAQCRAAMRVFTSAREASQRCLGAFIVQRKQRAPARDAKAGIRPDERTLERYYAEELRACKAVGAFQRFGDQDIAFVCDFCDGHLVWEDLERMPTVRLATQAAPPGSSNAPASLLPNSSNWQASGVTNCGQHQKCIVFAPVAIANHVVPTHGDWEAKLLCPLCEEIGEQPQDEDDDEEAYRPDEEFDDVKSLQEHLEWQHGPAALPMALPTTTAAENNCQIM